MTEPDIVHVDVGDARHNRTTGSRRQALQQPGRADDAGATAADADAELTIGRHEHDRIVALSRDGSQGVVAVSRRVDHFHPVVESLLDALLRLPFKDDHDWPGQGTVDH